MQRMRSEHGRGPRNRPTSVSGAGAAAAAAAARPTWLGWGADTTEQQQPGLAQHGNRAPSPRRLCHPPDHSVGERQRHPKHCYSSEVSRVHFLGRLQARGRTFTWEGVNVNKSQCAGSIGRLRPVMNLPHRAVGRRGKGERDGVGLWPWSIMKSERTGAVGCCDCRVVYCCPGEGAGLQVAFAWSQTPRGAKRRRHDEVRMNCINPPPCGERKVPPYLLFHF